MVGSFGNDLIYGGGGEAVVGENLIRNGDFEDHGALNRGDWGTFNQIDGWTATRSTIEIQEGTHWGTPSTPGDNSFLELDSHPDNWCDWSTNATVVQEVDIPVDGTYVLSLDYSPRYKSWWTDTSDTSKLEIRVGGQTVAVLSSDCVGWENYEFELQLGYGATDIELIGRGADDTYGALVDNIELRQVAKETLFGSDGNDTIYGDDGDDFIDGGLDDDFVSGGNGDDLVCGADGNDTLVGGEGADSLHGQGGYDLVDYSEACDAIAVAFSDVDCSGIGGAFRYADEGGLTGEARGDIFIEIEAFRGTAFDDSVYGADKEMSYELGDGDDTFDTDYYDRVADVVDGQGGNDRIYAGAGDDTLSGGAGNDTIDGEKGEDRIHGGLGDDYLSGGQGNDTFVYDEGGFGRDVISDFCNGDKIDLTGLGLTFDDLDISSSGGWWSRDTVIDFEDGSRIELKGFDERYLGEDDFIGLERPEGPGEDAIIGNRWGEWLYGTRGDDEIYGMGGNDGLKGRDGDDALFGGDGCDYLKGGDGRDTLNGGAHNDVLVGGDGADVFAFSGRDFGDDTISDWSESEGDKIDLGALNVSFDDVCIIDIGRDVLVKVGDFGTIRIEDTYTSSIGEDDFTGLV